MRRLNLCALGLLSIIALARAGWCETSFFPEQRFAAGNEAYKRGRYEEAAKNYSAILGLGDENGVVYYNLGNAYLKAGHKGEALWAYLKASRWMPGDADLNANLRYARSVLPASDGVSVKEPRLLRWLAMNHAWPTGQLVVAACALGWISLFAWLVVGWVPESRRLSLPLAWVAASITAVVFAALIAQSMDLYAASRGVVIGDNAAVRFSPQPSGTVHFSLPEGAVIRVLAQDNNWAQVRRADGRTGWLSLSSIKPL